MGFLELSALADIIAASAIVASLLFLAYEVAQNNKLSRLKYRREVVADLREFKLRATDPDFADIWVRGCKSFKKLTTNEKVAFESYLEIAIPAMIGVTVFSDMSWHGSANTRNFAARNKKALLDHPGVREWWVERQEIAAIGPPGRAALNRLIGPDGTKEYQDPDLSLKGIERNA